MNILMLTNTYAPHVGGVASSVQACARTLRAAGHQVLVVAPEAQAPLPAEPGVVRVPALLHVNGSDWAVPVPVPGYLTATLESFRPEVVHSHHPFLLGATGLRIAAAWDVPCVFTHHTQYERYTHYWPGDSPALKRFVNDLTTGYCNLTDAVVAPSTAIRDRLLAAGVTTPVELIPTGVDLERFAAGDATRFGARWRVPADAFVVGHVGRLAPEKNLEFLVEAVALYLERDSRARFVVVGSGPSRPGIEEAFMARGLAGRLHCTGTLTGDELADAYRRMDVFAFASTSETQGLVLAEAAAGGVPLVALSGPGVSDVVRDRCNGRVLDRADAGQFADALAWVAARPQGLRRVLAEALASTAREFSLPRTTARLLALYQRARASGVRSGEGTALSLSALCRRLSEDALILANYLDALLSATLRGKEA